MLEKEFQFYIDHQEDLVSTYKGKHIVIIGDKVIGAYDSIEEAYNKTIEDHEEGSFLIQECQPGEENYTQTFYSRAIF